MLNNNEKKGGAKLCSWCFKVGEQNKFDPKNTKKYKFRLYKEKPKKVKLSLAKPEADRAAISALGPGIGTTFRPSLFV